MSRARPKTSKFDPALLNGHVTDLYLRWWLETGSKPSLSYSPDSSDSCPPWGSCGSIMPGANVLYRLPPGCPANPCPGYPSWPCEWRNMVTSLYLSLLFSRPNFLSNFSPSPPGLGSHKKPEFFPNSLPRIFALNKSQIKFPHSPFRHCGKKCVEQQKIVLGGGGRRDRAGEKGRKEYKK